jgi:hypothetical protein
MLAALFTLCATTAQAGWNAVRVVGMDPDSTYVLFSSDGADTLDTAVADSTGMVTFIGFGVPNGTTWNFIIAKDSVPSAPNRPPAPPPDCTVQSVDETTMTLTWTTATDPEGNTPISYYCENIENSNINSGWIAATNYQFTNLTPGQTYSWRAKVKDSLGNESSWGASAQGTTVQPNLPPSDVTNLTAAFTGVDSLRWTWTAAADPEDDVFYYDIEYTAATTGTGATDFTGYNMDSTGYQDGSSTMDVSGSEPVALDTKLEPLRWYTLGITTRDEWGETSGTQVITSVQTAVDDIDPVFYGGSALIDSVSATHNSITFRYRRAWDEHSPPVRYDFREGTTYVIQDRPATADTTITLVGLDANTPYTITYRVDDAALANQYGWSDNTTAWAGSKVIRTNTAPGSDPGTGAGIVFDAFVNDPTWVGGVAGDSANVYVYYPDNTIAAYGWNDDVSFSGNWVQFSYTPDDSTLWGTWRAIFTAYMDGDSVKGADSFELDWTDHPGTWRTEVLTQINNRSSIDPDYGAQIGEIHGMTTTIGTQTSDLLVDVAAVPTAAENRDAVALYDLRQETSVPGSLRDQVIESGSTTVTGMVTANVTQQTDRMLDNLWSAHEYSGAAAAASMFGADADTNTAGVSIATVAQMVAAVWQTAGMITWAQVANSGANWMSTIDSQVDAARSDHSTGISLDNPTLAEVAAAVDDTLTDTHGSGSWEAGAAAEVAAIASAVEDTLSAIHGTAAWTGAAIGDGDSTYVWLVKASSDSSLISGARISIWNEEATTRYVNSATGSDGSVSSQLDPDTYWYSISDPGSYNPVTSTAVLSTDGDTTTVYLTAITVPATSNPDLCTMIWQSIDFTDTAVESLKVEATFDGDYGLASGLILAYRSVSAVTDTNGTASLDLVRSSEITSGDDVTTYTFKVSDISEQREAADTQFRRLTYEGVSVPDSASASVVYQLD